MGFLPAVKPAPVATAAGESLTVSALPPAVYGYIPEQHTAGKETQRNKERERERERESESERIHM